MCSKVVLSSAASSLVLSATVLMNVQNPAYSQSYEVESLANFYENRLRSSVQNCQQACEYFNSSPPFARSAPAGLMTYHCSNVMTYLGNFSQLAFQFPYQYCSRAIRFYNDASPVLTQLPQVSSYFKIIAVGRNLFVEPPHFLELQTDFFDFPLSDVYPSRLSNFSRN